jgi:hypothetical protein
MDFICRNDCFAKAVTSFDQLRSRILQHPEIKEASMSKGLPFVSFEEAQPTGRAELPTKKLTAGLLRELRLFKNPGSYKSLPTMIFRATTGAISVKPA